MRGFGRERRHGEGQVMSVVADAPLLEFRDVRAVRSGRTRDFVLFDAVSFEVGAGEHVAVLGRRNPGLGSLLRIAGGLEAPASGMVLFDGVDLARDRGGVRAARIAVVQPSFVTIVASASAVAHVASALLPQRLPARERSSRAHAVLERVGAPTSVELRDLTLHELMLVALARALVSDPLLVLVDEPAQGADPVERDHVAALLEGVAASGPGVLSVTADPNAVAGARLLHLSGSGLTGRAKRRETPVIPLPARRVASPGAERG